MKRSFFLMHLIFTLFAFNIQAQTLSLVKNINSYTDSDPIYFTTLNSNFYFWADDGVRFQELWKSDGTGSGTSIVKDINPSGGQPKSYITQPVVLNNALYFPADDGTHGIELWKSDGTDAGTVMVKDINPSNGSLRTGNDLINFNGAVYFLADDGTTGMELWKSDGTSGGTVLVKDINLSGDAFSTGTPFAIYNNTLFFTANDGNNGSELWKTDGTTSGTIMVKDINPITGYGSQPATMYVFNNTLFFNANDGTHGLELWKTDGTSVGTVMLKDIYPGAGNSTLGVSFISTSTELYFQADDGTHGSELWKTDGTTVGTMIVKDIVPGTGSSSVFEKDAYGIYKDKLYFSAQTINDGKELWVTDGTDSGTLMLKNINANSGSNPYYFQAYNGFLYFSADDGTAGIELWKTDGTSGGTSIVADQYQGTYDFDPSLPFIFNGSLYLNANGGEGYELWKLTTTPTSIFSASKNQISQNAFPNPTSNTVTIDLNNINNATSINVYNSLGVLVNNISTTSNDKMTLELDGYDNGVYFIIINGETASTLKIIKE